MKHVALLYIALTLTGCGLSEEKRAEYMVAMEQARQECQGNGWNASAACADYGQLRRALAEDRSLESYR